MRNLHPHNMSHFWEAGPQRHRGPAGFRMDPHDRPDFGPRGHHGHGPHRGGRCDCEEGRGHGERGGHRRGRARRGAIRLAILASLKEGPNNGYGIMKAVAEKTDDAWEPSPGAIYPAMQQLTEEGLIAPTPSTDTGEVGTYSLTPAGLTYVKKESDALDGIWNDLPTGDRSQGLRSAKMELFSLMELLRHATKEQRKAAAAELERTTKALHAILATDDPGAKDSDNILQ